MKRFMLSALVVLIAVTTLVSVAHGVPREEIVLTTIIPDQTVLIVKKGVVGYNYRRACAADPDNYVQNNNLLIEGNVGIGTTAPKTPAPNSQAGNLDVNDIWLRSANTGAGTWLSQSGGAAVTQIATATYTSYGDSGSIPWDNSTPLNTEGTQIFSKSFVPQYADSIIKIDVIVSGDEIGQTTGIVALFRDGTCVDAVASYGHDSPDMYIMMYFETAGSTNARTYSVRVGNIRINSSNDIANPPLGGKYISKMMITEYKQ